MKLVAALAIAVATIVSQVPSPPTNSIGMEFIRIEPGTMQVGVFRPDCENGGGGRGGRAGPPRDPRMVWDDADRAACAAQTKADRSDGFPVTIPKPYLIAKTEVTQAQWKAVMGTNPSSFQGDKVANPDSHPVERVTWHDAQAFVKALNAKEKTTAYRLPTEFEWEYACRAGGAGQQTWTDIRAQAVLGLGLAGRGGGGLGAPAPAAAAAEVGAPETPAQYTARTGMTNPVAGKTPNAWGLHDMLGNVWEWVADPYNGKIFPDASPPMSGSVHVLKGGGFASDVKNAICATHGFGPGDGFAVGFRVVKDVAGQASPLAPATDPAAGRASPADAAATERGRLLFAQTCSFCHGIDARGGAEGGSDLTHSPIVVADPTGGELGRFLQVGRPDKKMPPFPLRQAELADVAAFLRSAVAVRDRGASAVVVGDARAGEAFFKGAGNCTTCHSTTGDLKGVGLKYSTAALQGRIVLPRGSGGYPAMGVTEMPPFRSVTVTLPSGERHTGTLVSVSIFAVTLKDASGARRTFIRAENVPAVEIIDPLQAHLDLMMTMTDKTMHDLTAFLVTLR